MELVAIVTRLIFSVPLYVLTCLGRYRTDLPSSAGRPFSATHFLGHCFGLIPASGSFASSAFPVPPLHHWVPSHKAATCFGSSSPRFWVPQKNGAEKGDIFQCPTYMLSGIACSAVRSPTVPSLEHGLSSLATPGTEACDAAGGAFRPQWREWPAPKS